MNSPSELTLSSEEAFNKHTRLMKDLLQIQNKLSQNDFLYLKILGLSILISLITLFFLKIPLMKIIFIGGFFIFYFLPKIFTRLNKDLLYLKQLKSCVATGRNLENNHNSLGKVFKIHDQEQKAFSKHFLLIRIFYLILINFIFAFVFFLILYQTNFWLGIFGAIALLLSDFFYVVNFYKKTKKLKS